MLKIKASILIVIPLLLTICIVHNGLASKTDTLIVAKPFGPSVSVPDPAKGANGWYTSEAGVTETLFSLDLDMNLKPNLAESYKNIDPLHWEITLRSGVRFHDNTSLDAKAVKWSIERLLDKESSVFNIRIQKMLDLNKITVKDNRTLIFETHNPNAPFLYHLASAPTAIISSAGDSKNIYGTGPFVLDKVIANEKILLSRFDNYWGTKAQLAHAELHTIENPSTRMLAFESGQLDVVTDYPEYDINRIKSKKNINIYYRPTNRLCFLFVRVADGPLANPNIREALNYAIDRQMIIKTILAGIGGEASGSIFPDYLPWHNNTITPYPYAPDKALTLLTQAGAKDTNNDGILELAGKPLLLNMWTYEGRASLKPILELLQDQLLKVGIGTKIKITKTGSPINQAMIRGDVQLSLQMRNVAPEGDPDSFISNVFVTGAGSNFMGYNNTELDILADKGRTTLNPEARKIIYDQIQQIIYKDNPVIALFHKSEVAVTGFNVQNYRIHPAEKYLMTPTLTKKEKL
ncbi:MAG: ABC transporter substrate-binding protein [Desulfobulbaceae bacterium]|nr:ABC transporter substrate-binding protein [Desulfobulbaceae bacterium]